MDFEVCVERVDTAIVADNYGATRIELCSALDLGGLTPSIGIVESCVEKCSLDVFVMIRPRGGGFVYSSDELVIMMKNIEAIAKAGSNGVVFGCLTENFELNDYQNNKLLEYSKSLGLGVTFHRAFDFCKNATKSLELLINQGFDRILTSGKAITAIEGKDNIKNWVDISKGRIQIMAGSGINGSNAKIFEDIGVDALHFTARKKRIKEDLFNMGEEYFVDKDKLTKIIFNKA
jgi:copper homeostasis protein